VEKLLDDRNLLNRYNGAEMLTTFRNISRPVSNELLFVEIPSWHNQADLSSVKTCTKIGAHLDQIKNCAKYADADGG